MVVMGSAGPGGLPARGRLLFPAGCPVCRSVIGLGWRFHFHTLLNGCSSGQSLPSREEIRLNCFLACKYSFTLNKLGNAITDATF